MSIHKELFSRSQCDKVLHKRPTSMTKGAGKREWSGQFRVKWHIIKDVPNTLFRHIILDNNDHKPVTHSRDSQEVKLEKGIEMLKIFKEHDADTSLLEDFEFYDDREKFSDEKRDKEQVSSAKNSVDDVSVNQLSEKVAESLHLEKHKEAQ